MTPVATSSHQWGCAKPGAAHLHWWGSRSSTTHTERSMSMVREKPTVWGCDHHYPIEVVAVGDVKRARCLGCGAYGPASAAGEDAMLALRAEARHREKVRA